MNVNDKLERNDSMLFTKKMILVFLYALCSFAMDIDPSKTVNPATGEMVLSLPLVNLDAGKGISYPITLGYKAGIKTYQPASDIGLGFGMDLGSITRKVVLVPDDAIDMNQKAKSGGDEDGWIKFISVFLIVVSVIVAIICTVFGQVEGWAIPAAVISVVSSFVLGIAGMALSMVNVGPGDFIAGGNHVDSYNYDRFKTGFFSSISAKTHDKPDIYFLNTPYVSGELIYKEKKNDKFVFEVKAGSGDPCTKVEYDNNDKSFNVITKDGAHLKFKAANFYKSENYVKKYFRGDNSNNWASSTLTSDFVVGKWILESVETNKFLNSDRYPTISIKYKESIPGSHIYLKGPSRQTGPASSARNEIVYQNITYPEMVLTNNQCIYFYYTFDRLDKTLCYEQNNNKILMPRLTEMKVYSRNNELIKTIEFESEYYLRPNTQGAIADINNYYYVDGGGRIVSANNYLLNIDKRSLTLRRIKISSSKLNDKPMITKFHYNNPNIALQSKTGFCKEGNWEEKASFEVELRDLWGYYTDLSYIHHIDNIGDYWANNFNINGIKENISESDAWSLSSVTFPSGKEVKWTYESNRYDKVNNISVTSIDGKPKFGGGIRVKTLEVSDEMDGKVKKKYSYYYHDMDIPGNFGENKNSSGHCTVEPYNYLTDVDYRADLKTRGGHYTAAKIAYERTIIVEDDPTDLSSNSEKNNGYLVYDFVTPKDFQNEGVYGEIDKSWKRGRISSVSKYSSNDKLISEQKYKYNYQDFTRSVDQLHLESETNYNVIANGIVTLSQEINKKNEISKTIDYAYDENEGEEIIIKKVAELSEEFGDGHYSFEPNLLENSLTFTTKKLGDPSKIDLVTHFTCADYNKGETYYGIKHFTRLILVDVELDGDNKNFKFDKKYKQIIPIPTKVQELHPNGGYYLQRVRPYDGYLHYEFYCGGGAQPDVVWYQQKDWTIDGAGNDQFEYDYARFVPQPPGESYKEIFNGAFHSTNIIHPKLPDEAPDKDPKVKHVNKVYNEIPGENFFVEYEQHESYFGSLAFTIFYEKEFKYYKDYDLQPNTVTSTEGDGKKKVVDIIPAFKKYDKMYQQNMLTNSYQKIVYKDSKNDENVIYSEATKWNEVTYLYDQNRSYFYPFSKYTWNVDFDIDGNSEDDFTNFILNKAENPGWIEGDRLIKYNKYGKVIEKVNARDLHVNYLFGKTMNNPIAIFQNARHGECVFTSFEEDDNIALIKSDGTDLFISSVESHNGDRCLKISKGTSIDAHVRTEYTPENNEINVSEASSIIWEFWAKSDSPTKAYTYIQTNDLNNMVHGKTFFQLTTEWKKYQFSTTIPAGNSKRYSVVLSTPINDNNEQVSGSIYYDDLRAYPTDAFAKSFTYDIVSNKPTSVTDPNNNTVYNTYDGFGRLKTVKNNKKEVLKEIEYYTKSVEVFKSGRDKDSIALVNIYRYTNGSDWEIPSPGETKWNWQFELEEYSQIINIPGEKEWDFSTPINEWYGIYMTEDGTRVNGIELSDVGMEGRFPELLEGALSELVCLDLNTNDALFGEIPKSIYNLVNLEKISLHHCSFSGNISPSLNKLTKLGELNLSSNRDITGEIPIELGDCKHLYHLDLEYMSLTGIFPKTINSNLKYLQVIKLRDNPDLTIDYEAAKSIVGLSHESLTCMNVYRVNVNDDARNYVLENKNDKLLFNVTSATYHICDY